MSQAKESDDDVLIIDDSDDATALFGKNKDGSWRTIPTPKIDAEPLRFVKPSELPDDDGVD